MLIGLLASINALLPWLLGATLGIHAAKCSVSIPGFTAITAGIGGFLGYLAAALALWLTDQIGVPLLQYRYLLALGALTVFAVASLWPLAHITSLQLRASITSLLLTGLLSLYTIYFALLVYNLPAQGWDVFDHWGKVAAQFVDHSLRGQPGPFVYDHYHPKTLSLVLAWSAWCSTLNGNSDLLVWSMPWLGFSISAVLIAAGWTYNQTLNLSLALAISLATISIPLFENHVLIAGYSELPVGLGVMAGTVLAAIAFQRKSTALIAAAALTALTPIFLKNIGIAYTLAPLAAAALVRVTRSRPRYTCLIAITAAMAAIYIAYNGLVFEMGSSLLGYDADTKTVHIGSRDLDFAVPAASELLANELQSRFLNSSFSICLIAILLAIATSFIDTGKQHRQSIPLQFVALTFALLFMEQLFSQFTMYGFEFAIPERDTGLSRFSLPAFMLAPIFIAIALKPQDKLSPDLKSYEHS